MLLFDIVTCDSGVGGWETLECSRSRMPGGTMADYRLYCLDDGDHIVEAVECEADDDAAAIVEAVRIKHYATIEIWCGTRRVARVDPERRTPDPAGRGGRGAL